MGRTARQIAVVGALLLVPVFISFVTQTSGARAQDPSPRVVHSLPIAKNAATDSGKDARGDMGATYHYLESKATRVVTRFKDRSAVAERAADGDFRVRLHDAAGNELSQLAVDQEGLGSTRLEFSSTNERVITQMRPDVRPTLDWANAQAHALWQDRPDDGDDVEWRGRFLRGRHARAGDTSGESEEVESEFDGGTKVVSRKNTKDVELKPGLRRRPTFISHVTANGLEVGVIRWYAREQVLAWDFPGLTKGFVNPERLREKGGWTFVPTLEWANVQGLAFYDFHSRVKARGSVARATSHPFLRLVDFVAPTVSANDEGCDILHWLDSTVLRPCCDAHDRCYERGFGCTARSWFWSWGSTWTCSVCNTVATLCFVTGGLVQFDVQDWW